jgi:hypothetical protein
VRILNESFVRTSRVVSDHRRVTEAVRQGLDPRFELAAEAPRRVRGAGTAVVTYAVRPNPR